MTIFYKRSNKNTTKDEYLEKTDVVLFFPATGMDIKGASITLPLSLLCISAPLIEKGFKVKIIDQRLDNDWKKTLSKTIKDKPLCVGITAMTGKQINGAISASKLIKKINKSIPVVWGGAHASLLPEQTINNPFVDIVVVGEGEETFIELIERLKNGKMLKDVQGIFYKDSLNQIFRTKTRAFTNLDQLPNLPYNIVNIKNYTNSLLLDEPEISHFYSRGCPYDCGFCYNKKVNKRKWRVKKPEKLIKELKKIEQFGIKAVSFADEEFFIDLDKVKELCELIISNNINLKLMVSCRINDVLRFDEKFLDLLIKSGFTALYVGVESGADRVLKLINKNITKSQIISANAKLKKFKIDVYYSFMCGFPEENLEEIKDTVRLMLELYQDNKNAYILPIKAFTPYPGTELYDKCIDNGFEAPKTLEEWSKFQWNISHAKWLPNKTKRYISLVSYLTIFMDEKHVLKSKIGKRMLFLYYMAKTYAEFIRNRLVKGSFVNLDYDIVNLFRKASKFNISNLRKDICGAFSKT